ncbi:hypothetical protein OEZ86_002411 [Tetradesmus obliquus]|nr:hypothetical protein OEZ86_002411 [Tetradesmus obliquus]
MSSSSPVEAPAPPSVDDIDEQWEKFSKDGCPDWWLMAKYTHGWLARTFPYVPFRERAVSLPGDGASAGAAAALMSSGSVPTPATAAAAPAGRSHSLSEVELLQALPASLPASQDAPSSVRQQAQQQQQLRGRAASLDSARDPAAADRSPHPSSLQQQQNCGNPLKGLFACQCAAPAGVDKPVQQVPS